MSTISSNCASDSSVIPTFLCPTPDIIRSCFLVTSDCDLVDISISILIACNSVLEVSWYRAVSSAKYVSDVTHFVVFL